jgi:hypothetical protein
MVAINPVTGQFESVNSKGEFDETVVYTDQKTCLATRQEMATPGIYLCLAYEDRPYMMEIARKIALRRVRKNSRKKALRCDSGLPRHFAVCPTAPPMSTRMTRPLGC